MAFRALIIGRMLVAAGAILAGRGPVLAQTAPCGTAWGPALLAQEAGRVEEPEKVANSSPDPGPNVPAAEAGAAPVRGTGSNLGLLAIVGAGAAAAWWSWRRGLITPTAPATPEVRPGTAADGTDGPAWPLLILAGALVWLAQALGAGSAVVLLRLTPADAPTLRGIALTALGGYAGSIAAAAVAAFTIPGLLGAIGARLSRRSVISGLIAFVLILPIVLAVGVIASTAASWIAGWLGLPPPSELAHATLRMLAAPGPGEGLWRALTIVAVVVGAPIAEEFIYRGCLQSGLRLAFGREPATRWGAVVVTSTLFALMHAGIADPHALPTLFVLSLGLGIAYERTGSLAVPICVHALFNAANIALAWLPG